MPASLRRLKFADDPLFGDDTPLALYMLYELHYRGFDGVDDDWEWDVDLHRLRTRLQRAFLARTQDVVEQRFGRAPVAAPGVADELRAIATADGPSVSAFMASEGTLQHMREFAVHRSAYQLKEADPHTWAIPRLAGRSKAALVRIQTDEYGNGREPLLHSTLFADTMRALRLDDRYGAYLDLLPGFTLATVNLVTMFGLHRRWRGALIGHLALFEMCSVTPMSRYVEALERFGIHAAVPFYDAHVSADQWHQVIALDDMVGGLVASEPQLAADIVFGARALDIVERTFARELLDAWSHGESSLRAATTHPGLAPQRAAVRS
ncbi:MAG TPA: iron-containing redox enzyme family protein [Acidimicrobiia bacterium]